MPGLNDPNDPQYANEPGKYAFQNGKWVAINGGGSEFWNDPNSAWSRDWGNVGKSFDDAAVALGYAPKNVDQAAPGGLLDTSQADAEREQQNVLLGQLQQQAATGGGAWEGTLADATKRASSSAQALGQSIPGSSYASALRNIGSAQGAALQRSAGQANILRAESQRGAQDQLSNLLGAQGDADANQAAATAAARQGVAQLNATLESNANAQTTRDSTSFGGMAAGMSDGGKVPGTPKVFGDDSRNDTVPAKLSPGEIVIPRSHSSSPEAAAQFVRALQAKKEPLHFDQGGQVPGDGTGLNKPDPNSSATARGREAGAVSVFLPHVGAAMRQTSQQAPSIESGGLLDVSKYNDNRAAQLANTKLLAQRASGAGPSVAPQQMQNATDENIAAAMQSGSRLGAANVLQRATAANQGAAGNAAGASMDEQAGGQAMYAKALVAQRARDAALSLAQQQAAFRQTQMNAGLGLEQQAAMRSLMAGAGQAATASASNFGRDNSYSPSDNNTPSFDQGFGPGGDSGGSDPSEWENPYWTGGLVRKPKQYAAGGQVEDTRGADFVRALKARGGR